MTDAKNPFQKVKTALAFGFYHPIAFVSKSKSVLGVNLLRIADNKPDLLQKILSDVISLIDKGELKLLLGAKYPANKVADAHELLESGKSKGKIVLDWTDNG
jgi:NADPH2:quinone reductase